MRFLSSGFFHESIVNRRLSNHKKYFQQIFRFGTDIREQSLFHSDFWVTKQEIGQFPNIVVCTTSGLRYPEVAQYPGIVTRRLCNFRVTISGGCTIFGNRYPEVEFCDHIMKICIF